MPVIAPVNTLAQSLVKSDCELTGFSGADDVGWHRLGKGAPAAIVLFRRRCCDADIPDCFIIVLSKS